MTLVNSHAGESSSIPCGTIGCLAPPIPPRQLKTTGSSTTPTATSTTTIAAAISNNNHHHQLSPVSNSPVVDGETTTVTCAAPRPAIPPRNSSLAQSPKAISLPHPLRFVSTLPVNSTTTTTTVDESRYENLAPEPSSSSSSSSMKRDQVEMITVGNSVKFPPPIPPKSATKGGGETSTIPPPRPPKRVPVEKSDHAPPLPPKTYKQKQWPSKKMGNHFPK
ncbi:hypothetical protein D917_05405 [Trichinella nativa]|uniref:Uncharacterized protein n=1 Tax=Trichinella nativa TaxID=6335 RepID=A0A1Y3E365_9BILA|nr:hypothetical protein D917_05405 [Trichinella nativa]